MKSIENRRSVRKYSSRPIDDTLLHKLLAEAERTQTMGNMQLYSVVITRSEEGKRRLAPLHFNQPMVTEAPVVLTFCADTHRASQWCCQREATPGYGNLLSFLNAATDALLYLQTFSVLAEEEGLGLCFLGTTVYNTPELCRTLNLPQLVIPVGTLTLGWPAEQPQMTDRLPLEAVIHEETYHDPKPADIDRFYAMKESLPESIEAVKENGKKTLAQVFTDVRYTKEAMEQFSGTYLAALRQQGFIE